MVAELPSLQDELKAWLHERLGVQLTFAGVSAGWSWRGPELTFYTGIWKGNARLHIVSGPNDGDNRAIAAKVKTGEAPALYLGDGAGGFAELPYEVTES